MLPDELCLKILHYLSRRDVCTCMRVCRRLNALCNDASLWTEVRIPCRYVMHAMLSVRYSIYDTCVNASSIDIYLTVLLSQVMALKVLQKHRRLQIGA